MDNNFQTLHAINVNDHVEKKNGLSYLSWAFAWAEFKKHCPDATYEIKKDENGRPYFGDPDYGYMVYTSVTAGGQTYEMWLPVMDNNNKSLMAKPYSIKTRRGEIYVDAMTMFDVNKAIMRCLVKNIAMFGLGLYIYAGEDLPEDEAQTQATAEPRINKDHWDGLVNTYTMVFGKAPTKKSLAEFTGMSYEEAREMSVTEWTFLMEKLDRVANRGSND